MSVKKVGLEPALLADERRRIDRAVDRRAALRERTQVLAERFRRTKERHAITADHADFVQALEIHRVWAALQAEIDAERD